MQSLSICLAVTATLVSLALTGAGQPNFLRYRHCSSSPRSAAHPRHRSLRRCRSRPRDLRVARGLRGNDAGRLCGGDVRLTDAVRGACHVAVARRGDRGFLALFYGRVRGVEANAASLIPYAVGTTGLHANGVGGELVAKAAIGKIASANASETERQRCSR